MIIYLVCEAPFTPQANSILTAADVSGQFLASDTLDYDWNGALVPEDSAATLRTCNDLGPPNAIWQPTEATTPLPRCCKYTPIAIMTL